jgi:hypothetical protein
MKEEIFLKLKREK